MSSDSLRKRIDKPGRIYSRGRAAAWMRASGPRCERCGWWGAHQPGCPDAAVASQQLDGEQTKRGGEGPEE